MKTHTETPWQMENRRIFTSRGVIAVCPLPQQNGVFDVQSNAEFIVRACNSHDALLAVLKEALTIVSDRSAGGRMLTSQNEAKRVFHLIKAAITLAEKGEIK